MRFASFLLLILILFGCSKSPRDENVYVPDKKSKELSDEAINLLMFSDQDQEAKIDSSLKLVNQAIEIDDKNFQAYYNKSIILSYRKDLEGLLENNSEILKLRPNQPVWIVQRGFFYDLQGDSVEAQRLYDNSIKIYEDLIESDYKDDMEFRLEYITALETKGDLQKAEKELTKLRAEFPENEVLKHRKLMTKTELKEFWNSIGTEEEKNY